MARRFFIAMAMLCTFAASVAAQNDLRKAIDAFRTNKEIAVQPRDRYFSCQTQQEIKYWTLHIYSFLLTRKQKPLLDRLVEDFLKKLPGQTVTVSKSDLKSDSQMSEDLSLSKLRLFGDTTTPIYLGQERWKRSTILSSSSKSVGRKIGKDEFLGLKYWELSGDEKYAYIGSIIVVEGPNDEVEFVDESEAGKAISKAFSSIDTEVTKATKATKIEKTTAPSRPSTLVTMLHQIGVDKPNPSYAILFLEKWQETLESNTEDPIVLHAILEDIDATIKNYQNKNKGEKMSGIIYLEAASKLGHKLLDKKK